MLVGTVLALALQAQPAAEPPPPSARLVVAAEALAALPNTTLKGYVVSGRNLRTVRAAMMELRPADDSGTRHDAWTSWLIQPRLMRRGAVCEAASAHAEYSVTVTLPDLETPEALSQNERAAWDRYFSALVSHEINHVRIVQEGAERVAADMRAATGCEAIHAASQTSMAAIGEASAQYDLQTRHGASEGAVLVVQR
jgi:predicted secreted Zn-dependent protease